MKENKADIIFHPVRIRIVQALFGGRQLTADQMVKILHGPSIATLYRHLNRLVEADIIAIVEERRVRGAVEKVYALAGSLAAEFNADEMQQSSPDDQMRHFTTLTGTLLNDFAQHLEHDPAGWASEGTFVRQEALNLTDEEARQMRNALMEALTPYLLNLPAPSRRRHLLTAILLSVIEMPVIEMPVIETPVIETMDEEQGTTA